MSQYTIETELEVLRKFVEEECERRFDAPIHSDGTPTEYQDEASRAVAAARRLYVWLKKGKS